jgi:hypothetical protein
MATKAKSKELAPQDTSRSNLPAYLLGQETGSGLKGLDMSDFVIPRVKLIQGTSDEPKTFDDAKQGEFWLNVLDMPLGTTLDFIPISNRKRYLLSVPLGGSPKGILARADDGVNWKPDHGSWDVQLPKRRGVIKWEIKDPTVRGSGLAEFGTADPENPDSNPAATLFYDYLVYLPGFADQVPGPVLLSLARSQAKRARDLNAKIEMRRAPMQSMLFRAGITTETGQEGDYYNLAFQANGWASEEQFNMMKEFGSRYTDYRGYDEEGEAAEGGIGAGVGGGKSSEKDF